MKMKNIPAAIIHYISELFSHWLKRSCKENTHDIICNFFVISFRCGKPNFSDCQQSFFITDLDIILDYFIYPSQKSVARKNTKTSIKLVTIKRTDFAAIDNSSCNLSWMGCWFHLIFKLYEEMFSIQMYYFTNHQQNTNWKPHTGNSRGLPNEQYLTVHNKNREQNI